MLTTKSCSTSTRDKLRGFIGWRKTSVPEVTKEQALQRAQQMKALPPRERDAAIAASENVIDARGKFADAEKRADMERAYRRGKNK